MDSTRDSFKVILNVCEKSVWAGALVIIASFTCTIKQAERSENTSVAQIP